ncbi:MAG: dihydrofolate reductase, partial [Phycisphaerae bacterium]
VLMGRKSFDSIGKLLPHRTNLILSRQIVAPRPAGTQWFTRLSEAIAAAEQSGEQELFVVGGAEIYALTMGLADRMYISMIHLDKPPMGDAWFPQWRPEEWRLEARRQASGVEFLTYRRVTKVKT